MTVINVPTINDDWRDFQTLLGIWYQATQAQAVRLEFRECRFLRQNAVAFLGGLVRLLRYRGVQIVIGVNTLQPIVRKNLAKNGFLKNFVGEKLPWTDNSIPYREDWHRNPAGFQHYLSTEWLGRGWIGVSPGLRDSIVERVAETYVNAFDHASSPVGVYTCGQYFPQLKQLHLTLVDFGVGIPSNVRMYHQGKLPPHSLTGAKYMEWAFQRGTSTRSQEGISRGLGLDLLRSFIQTNKGRLEIMSHDGYICIVDNGVNYDTLSRSFEGTLVNIRLQCDDRYYALASENVSVVSF